MNRVKLRPDSATAIGSAWSLDSYLAWQAEAEAREAEQRARFNCHILARGGAEGNLTERAMEEGWEPEVYEFHHGRP